MAKAKKSKKKKGYNPPLTFLDKFIYILFLIIIAALSVSLIFLAISIQKVITFKDTSAITFEGTGSNFWIIPLIIHIFITGLVIGICGLEYKIPLFGNPDIRYGEAPYNRNVYPLFKRKQYVQEPKSKKNVWYKYLILVWCVIFLVFACLFPLGICGRQVIYDDSKITIFNVTNSEKQTYSHNDFEHLTIRTYQSFSRYGSNHWCYEIVIKMSDGKKISFTNKMSEEAIDEFIEMKELLSKEKITIKGAHNLDKVIQDNKLDNSRSEKLKDLFSN